MTYAIVEASGTQLRVEPGRFYDVNRLHVEEDGTVNLDRVLYVSHEGETMVGQPLVEGATVSATVMRHLRGRKVIVYKMQPKKKTRKKRGHRQELTRIMIDGIRLNGELLAGEVSAVPEVTSESVAAEPEAPEAIAEELAGVETAPEVAETEPVTAEEESTAASAGTEEE